MTFIIKDYNSRIEREYDVEGLSSGNWTRSCDLEDVSHPKGLFRSLVLQFRTEEAF